MLPTVVIFISCLFFTFEVPNDAHAQMWSLFKKRSFGQLDKGRERGNHK